MALAQIRGLLFITLVVAAAANEKKDEKPSTRGGLAQTFGQLGGHHGSFGHQGSFGGRPGRPGRPGSGGIGHGGVGGFGHQGGFGGGFGHQGGIGGGFGHQGGIGGGFGHQGGFGGGHRGGCGNFCKNVFTSQFEECCCPVVRSHCPGSRFGAPRVCTTNDQCNYTVGEVCCEDACFQHRVCKPRQGYRG